MNKKIIAIGLILVLSTTVFSGCVDDNSETNDEQNNENNNAKTYTINTNYPRDRLGLNEQGETAFTAACNKFSDFNANMTVEDARTSLVDELNNDFDFIKEAGLSEDGYTIAVIFEDDTAALMITETFDSEEAAITGSQFSTVNTKTKSIKDSGPNNKNTISSKEILLTPLASEIDSSTSCDVDFVVPQSKKVLILNAASLSNPFIASYEEEMVIKSCIENGWTKNDIDIKKRLSRTDGGLIPDDFFDCSGYGLIMYMGHGGYCSSYEGSIPGHHYIVCCNYVDFTSMIGKERDDQYLTWRDQGRLIVTGCYNDSAETEWSVEYSIDTDLIMENIEIDPGTIVYIDSCNSYRVADAYLNNDAGCFFGFDYKSHGMDSGRAFYQLIKAMINEEVSQNGADALNEIGDIFRTCRGGGILQIYDNGKDVYLPSFGKLVVQPTSPPSGTSYYELEFSPYGTTEKVKINAGEEIEYDGVSPVNTTITIRAKSSAGNTIESSIVTPLIQSGENELLTITLWNTYGIILEADPSTVEPDGISTSTITATLKTFLQDDVLEPTGEPIVCREVEFITNFGTFLESSKVLTDINGEATVELSSDIDGIATVRAIVEKDGMESYKTQNITFGEVPYSFRLAERRQNKADASGDIIEVMSWGYYLVFKGKEGVDYYIITKNHSNPRYSDGYLIKEYSTTGELPYEDDYYEELRLLTDEERAEWDKEYDEDGLKFFLFRGKPVSTSETSDAWKTNLAEKQSSYYTELNDECTFTIEAYNS